jgi:preprotein translocase subunit SecD
VARWFPIPALPRTKVQMEGKRNWQVILVVAFLVLAVLALLPTFARYTDKDGKQQSHLPAAYTRVFDKTINYGLDLEGGLELRYTVDYKKAIEDNLFRVRDGLGDRLATEYAKKAKKGDFATLSEADRKALLERFKISREPGSFNKLRVEFTDAADKALLDENLLNTLDPSFKTSDGGPKATLVFMPDKAVFALRDKIVDQTLEVIRKRIDAFGLVEPDVRKSGDTEIDLQLPGLSQGQMSMIRERIGQAAQLTFRMVRQDAKVFEGQAAELDAFKKANPDKAKTLALVPDSRGAYLKADKKSELERFVREAKVPEDVMIGFEQVEDKDPRNGQVTATYWRTHNLTAKTELTGDNLTRAQVGYGQKNEPVVNLEFDSRGAKTFADLTEKNVGNLMAILLDDDVNSAPQIREAIRGGHAQITLGRGTNANNMRAEADSLVAVLNNGAYKAPVIKVHDIEVGPSLGKDAVNSGLTSMMVGVLLVVVFMALYYRQGGLIANVALVFNLMLQLACLVWFNAALTLPGMAGLTLTTAMAVDANILIFERIREELRLGKTVSLALAEGYDHAFWTIFDSHITAAIAGGVLMNYSSGPIYGFAVTLLIGIGTSMFTSIVGTRVIYDYLLSRGKLRELSV